MADQSIDFPSQHEHVNDRQPCPVDFLATQHLFPAGESCYLGLADVLADEITDV